MERNTGNTLAVYASVGGMGIVCGIAISHLVQKLRQCIKKKNVFIRRGRLPQVVLGTMTFSDQTDFQSASSMLKLFSESGGIQLDSARMYNHGMAEQLLGRLLQCGHNFSIATKINPFPGFDKSLSSKSVHTQLNASLSALGHTSVDILYLHAPDPNTPVLETLAAVQDLYQEGRFTELGLSNYSAWEVVHIWHLCNDRNWVLPTVYQGMYNPITRQVEDTLIPALRTLGIRFYAYNPLAGGLLSGKHTSTSLVTATNGRFKHTNKMYRDRFIKDVYLQAMEDIRSVCKDNGISMVQAVFSWMMVHSQLEGALGDAVILGASKLEHLQSNMMACTTANALPQDVCDVFDAGWQRILEAGACPPYQRGFSKQPVLIPRHHE